MAKHKKAGCGTMAIGCLGFVVAGFVLFGLGMQFISDTVSENIKEAERLDKEKPLGTPERMKHEVLQSVRTDGTTTIDQNGKELDILIRAKDVPVFGPSESGVQMEYAAILNALHRSGFQDFDTVSITSYAPMYNKLGNEETLQIASAAFDKSTLDSVNWENFIHPNLNSIARDITFHPAVEREQ
tara:strand:+ start:634 stop:1188 length:555 start_codon:yes stop_codon:yes gene_type:complete